MPGSKNERIDYREIREQSLRVAEELGDTPVAEIIAIKGEDYIGESLNALGEALGVFLQVARAEKDPEKRIGYYRNVVAVADNWSAYCYSRLHRSTTAVVIRKACSNALARSSKRSTTS